MTTLNDHKNITIDQGYQFGGVGILKRDNEESFSAIVTYPGSDKRRGGMGIRQHPIEKENCKHTYTIYLKIHKTDGYPTALQNSWNLAFDLYNPLIYKVNLKDAYRGLITTINHYYMEEPIARRAGFPWSVNLKKIYRRP